MKRKSSSYSPEFVEHVSHGDLWDTSDVASFFNVSKKTVGAWAKRKLFPTRKLPGSKKNYYWKQDVLAAIRPEDF